MRVFRIEAGKRVEISAQDPARQYLAESQRDGAGKLFTCLREMTAAEEAQRAKDEAEYAARAEEEQRGEKPVDDWRARTDARIADLERRLSAAEGKR